MARRIPILLKGGPCDGRKTTARVADFGPVGVMCNGVDYQPTAKSTPSGRLIYNTKASLEPKPVPDPDEVAHPLHAHNAWHGMLRHVFVEAPKELVAASKARRAMRELRHRRGLR